MSDVKRFDVPSMRSLINGEQAVMGHEVVLASDYDALAAKLAMAEDAAAKGDAARQQCGGMEMEIEELRAELAELRARVVSESDIFASVQAVRDRYPVAVFPSDGASVDCKSAAMARVVCDAVMKELSILLNQDKENGNG
ncbi:hypothetical protein NTA43_15980 [Pseudomonas aeruginosa]|uniref:hypothetical protein n=1 Tax=Pseudomonas aeruginosa TaxID=287 RepID=UPI0005B76EE3|nr:hypothetical protein [Pseudomonas aeruginosa]AZM80473.1 hypothetical protein EIP87_00080 [Pseudomonas aeruginosa]EKU7018602.1 hypothetical protein [Pseudomonas aeruginosa]KSN10853.1 hypothetical protein APA83_29130 [Pseudomonas aeruginosa]MCM6742431.1 hypothetical protein [Pseudomonas aeruginosa]MCR6879199.1 hypothetical protein [Pseudomonas aeruginosa]